MSIAICFALGAIVQGSTVGSPSQTPQVDRPAEFIVTVETTQSTPSVRLYDPASGQDTSHRLGVPLRHAAGLELLPLDAAGRAELTSFLPGQAQVRDGVVVLPGERGTVHRYRRPGSAGSLYGFLYAPYSGVPRVLFERGPDPAGLDPFIPFVGAGPFGRAVLVATTVAAGGDLMELAVDSGAVMLRTPGGVPHAFGRGGMALCGTWGFGVASDGIWRFPRHGSGVAQAVQVAAPVASWTGEAAVSPRRAFGVALAVTSGTQGVPYAFGPAGPAFPAADTPANLAPAGYAADTTFGPFLAIADDGRTVAWRVEDVPSHVGVFSNEVMVGRLGAPALAAEASGDVFMADTIAEVGRVIPAPDGGILFVAGEPNDPTEGGLEAADVFRATMSPGGTLTLENVSGSSGDHTVPFTLPPMWTPARMVLVTPTSVLVHEDDAKQLLMLDLRTGAVRTVLDLTREVAWIEVMADGGWCAAVERDTPGREWQVVGSASPAAPLVVLEAGSPSTSFDSPAVNPERTAAAYVRRDISGSRISVVEPGLGSHVSTGNLAGGPPVGTISFATGDDLAFTATGLAGGRTVYRWRFAAPTPPQAVVTSVGNVRLLR